MASFVAVFPISKPRYLVYVVFDRTNVAFNTAQETSCTATLYGSSDGRRYIALADGLVKSNGADSTAIITFSSAAPAVAGQQTFYFKAKVLCGRAQTVSLPTKLRYSALSSGSGSARGGARWLDALKRNLAGR